METAFWTTSGVGDWLEGLGLGTFVPIFEKNQIDGKSLLLFAEEDLEDLGIGPVDRKILLLEEIEKLKNKVQENKRVPMYSNIPLNSYISTSKRKYAEAWQENRNVRKQEIEKLLKRSFPILKSVEIEKQIGEGNFGKTLSKKKKLFQFIF